MKTKIQFLLLLISFSFFSCNSTIKKTAVAISNIDTDFPVTEQLEFDFFKKYDIVENGTCIVDGSILWYIRVDGGDLGTCYDLSTGEKLSTIALRGRAANELTELRGLDIIGDSIHFYTYGNSSIKSFAQKDIIDNVPMGERGFSVVTTPDSILISRMIKLPNGSVLATIRPAEVYEQSKVNELNQKSIAVFNEKEVKTYQIIDYETFDIEDGRRDIDLSTTDLIKATYADGNIAIKDNDMAVFSLKNQFILYTFDIKNGNVVNEKRYTKVQREKVRDGANYMPHNATNDRRLDIHKMVANEKYILCEVSGYLSDEDKETELFKSAIFVFDWQLNPIQKIDLPNREKGYYIISNDCKSVYFCEYNEEGLALYKADLNI